MTVHFKPVTDGCSCKRLPEDCTSQCSGGKYKGILDVLLRIVNEEGYQKLWAGVSSSLLLVRTRMLSAGGVLWSVFGKVRSFPRT